MKKITELESVDIHIEFADDGKFGFCINAEPITEDITISVDNLRIMARTLTRMAMEMWAEVDKALK